MSRADEQCESAAEPSQVVRSSQAEVEAALLAALAAEACVVLPTDTVYGLAGLAGSAAAVRRLLAIKGRGLERPPPLLVADPDDLADWVAPWPAAARRLAEAFWPGPLTLVLPLAAGAGGRLGFAADSVAVRLPDHDRLRALLRRSGPLACSSANRHDRPPATSVEQARAALGSQVACYWDGGRTPGPVPSSIVSFLDGPGGRLLRWGRLDPVALAAAAPELDRGRSRPVGLKAG